VVADSRDRTAPIATLRHWYVLTDGIVFACWVTLVSIILRRHEPWADEAQAWLIARDLNLSSIWFHELRYEGTPGLWHTTLWFVQHLLHAPYSALGITGMLCAAAGVVFILWRAPFLRPLRYMLIFSYFLVYQYAVVARSYNLLPLFLFMAAYFYSDRSRPIRMCITLIFLSSVAVHGMLLALALGCCYLLELRRDWPTLSRDCRRQYMACVVLMGMWFLFLFFILRPTPDVAEFAQSANPLKPHQLTFGVKLGWVITFAFFDQIALSVAFLLFAGFWCYHQKKLLPYVLCVGMMTFFFAAVHGRPHHHGTVFLAAVAGIWIAWPTVGIEGTSATGRLLNYAMLACLAVLFSVNIWDAMGAMKNDYSYPYSGSFDAARFLQAVRTENTTVFGYNYGMSAVQAYFNHNILANVPTTYFHEGLPMLGASLDLNQLQVAMPQYVIQYSNADKLDFANINPYFIQSGYTLVHISYGSIFYKRTWYDDDTYFIYRRNPN